MSRQVAYTAPFGTYPEYANLTFHANGSSILTVRSQGDVSSGVINLPPEELKKFGQAMLDRAKELGM